MTAKNAILVNFEKTEALAFTVRRKAQEACVAYFKNYTPVRERTVSIAIADRLYAKAMRNGYEVGF